MSNKKNYLNSKYFNNKDIKYGFFSRRGGVSTGPFDTLNCSYKSGDSKINVKKNIELALKALDFTNPNLIIGKQFHSNKVITIKNKFNIKKKYNADGFVTKNTNVALGILTADCAPIFFYDSINKIIGAAHAGWRGCLKNICYSIVKSMNTLGSSNDNIEAIVGPCIKTKCYEVSDDLYVKFVNKNNKYSKFFVRKMNGKYQFNLASTLKYQLINLKIKKVILSNEDTFGNSLKYFSHRRASFFGKIRTGRMINIIGFVRK